MPERDEALNVYLQRLRREAGLTLAQVCDRTKIQVRYVEALEAGRYGELPSNTHLRAFSLALAQACGGDSTLAAGLVAQVLSAVVVQGLAPEPSFSQAPVLRPAAPEKAVKPAAPRPKGPAPKAKTVAPPLEPQPALAEPAAPSLTPSHPAPDEGRPVQGASQRLRALPWQALAVLVGGAVILSLGLTWMAHAWKARADAAASSSLVAPSTLAAVADLASGRAT
jgi:hypothetical protein